MEGSWPAVLFFFFYQEFFPDKTHSKGCFPFPVYDLFSLHVLKRLYTAVKT